MSNISIKTQGVRGGNPQYKDKVGYATIFLRHSEDSICVDDFEGRGDNYKKREISEITIRDNGKILFQGNKYELFEKLKR